MKLISMFFTLIILLFTSTCKNQTQNSDTMEISGKIEAIQMTSWQYGTHTITNDSTFYALKSENTNLENYEGQTITIEAKKIEGYPVDGGPEYLEVIKVKE